MRKRAYSRDLRVIAVTEIQWPSEGVLKNFRPVTATAFSYDFL